MGAPFRSGFIARAKRAARLAVPALLLAAPAAAQRQDIVYDRLSVRDVHDLLLLQGLRVLTQELDGEDLVANDRVAVDDVWAWYVYLYNCDADGGCADLEFRLAYSGVEPGLEALNGWNARYRFTRAYAQDGFAVLSMDVNADGGVTVESISALVPIWRRAVGRFAEMLAPQAPPVSGEPG